MNRQEMINSILSQVNAKIFSLTKEIEGYGDNSNFTETKQDAQSFLDGLKEYKLKTEKHLNAARIEILERDSKSSKVQHMVRRRIDTIQSERCGYVA